MGGSDTGLCDRQAAYGGVGSQGTMCLTGARFLCLPKSGGGGSHESCKSWGRRGREGAPEDTQGSSARGQASCGGGQQRPQRPPTGPVMLSGTTPCDGAGTEKQEPPGSPHTCLGLMKPMTDFRTTCPSLCPRFQCIFGFGFVTKQLQS